MADELTTHTSCPQDDSCTTCGPCGQGLCPGTLFAGAILIGWLLFLGLRKLVSPQKSPDSEQS